MYNQYFFLYIYFLLLDRTQQHGESLDSILNSFEQYDATVTRVDRPVVVALVNKLRTVAACRNRTRGIHYTLYSPRTTKVYQSNRGRVLIHGWRAAVFRGVGRISEWRDVFPWTWTESHKTAGATIEPEPLSTLSALVSVYCFLVDLW